MHNEISQMSITVILTAVVRFWLNVYSSVTCTPQWRVLLSNVGPGAGVVLLKRQLSDCQPVSPHLERRWRPSLVQARVGLHKNWGSKVLDFFFSAATHCSKGWQFPTATGLPEGQFGRRLSNQERQSVWTQKFYSNSNRKISSNRN